MTEDDIHTPQLYLVSPPVLPENFAAVLGDLLDACDVACFRLALAAHDEDDVARAADMCREVCHARDVAIVIDSHLQLVERLGLDGVHLPDGSKQVRYARKELGPDAIVGCHSGTSKHDGMNAAEIGADYVCLGPVTPSSLGDGSMADTDTFAWWSDFIEVPVVAEGNVTSDAITALRDKVDFFAFGAEVWTSDDPIATLRDLSRQTQV